MEGERGIPRRSCSDILASRKMRDLVRDRNTQKTKSRGRCQIGEQAKEIFRIQFAAVKCARDVYTSLDIFCEKG